MIPAVRYAGWSSGSSAGVAKRILIIEDEQDVADLVAEVLAFEGYEARVAAADFAVDEALAFRPHAVLLDLMMPVVDGFEVARRLRSREETRAVPIVVMTAMHDAAARAAEVGTGHWLAKPFDIGELIVTVKRVTA